MADVVDSLQDKLAEYNELLARNPLDASILLSRGLLYFDIGRLDAAIRDIDRVVELQPNNALAHNTRGTLHYKAQNHPSAFSDFNRAIELNPEYAGAYNNRGNLYQKLQMAQQALEDYSKAIQFGPERAYIYYNRGIVNIDLGNDSDALADLTAAIGINPDYAMAYYKRGMLQIRFRSFDNALEDFIHSIAIERRQQDATGQIEDTGRSGTRLLRNGVRQKYLDGLAAVREAIDGLGEETIPLWTRLAWAYRVLVRDPGLETECMDRTVSVAPDNAVSLHNRAISAIQNGQPRRALLDLNKAIQLNPGLAHSYLRRAEILADTLGDAKGAISDFRKFIELRPEAPHAKAARMRIAELGGRAS